MQTNNVIIDAFSRVKEVVHESVHGLALQDLTYRPTESANSIAWLIWHLTRIQDSHIAELAKQAQVWHGTWFKTFNLPFGEAATGYGHSTQEVAAVKADSDLLRDYFNATHRATINFVHSLHADDYTKIVDSGWDPPVTMAIRLVSIVADNLQHAGQAAYVRGLLRG